MNILIVYAHPEPTSFNAALKNRAVAVLTAAGHDVTVSDLHAESFNPVPGRHDFLSVADAGRFHYQTEQLKAAQEGRFAPDIAREQARVAVADILILQFPVWWGGVPAILKGWFDRVLAYGFAYADGRRFDTGLFKGRRALISVTTGGPLARFTEGDVYGHISRALWQPQQLTLAYMGYDVAEPFVAYAAPRVDAAQRAAYLDALGHRVTSLTATPIIRATQGDRHLVSGAQDWTRPI